MGLIVIYKQPQFKHTIGSGETTFLYGVQGADYYYHNNGVDHVIDVRYSDEPSDYSNWVIGEVKTGKVQNFSGVLMDYLPKQAYDKALDIIRFNTVLKS